jgi:hypothetical protein
MSLFYQIITLKLVISLLLLTTQIANAQNTEELTELTIRNDSIFQNQTLIGYKDVKDNCVYIYYRNESYKKKYKKSVENISKSVNHKLKFRHIIDSNIGLPKIIFKDDQIYHDEKKIGHVETKGTNGHEIADFIVYGKLIPGSIRYGYLSHIKRELKKEYKPKLRGLNRYEVFFDFTEVRRKEALRKDSLKREGNKLFYDFIYQRLSSKLQSIEGVYKSIDKGEAFEYDIVILKNTNDHTEFLGWIIGSTDPDLEVGNILFSLKKTSKESNYIMSYRDKRGNSYENKLSIFNNGILTAEIKSYVKMYPIEGENKPYQEIKPLVDWDACGSGVALSNQLIATNYHVIKDSKSIRIKTLSNDSTYIEIEAKVVAFEMNSDIAILKLSEKLPVFNDDFLINLKSNYKLGENVFTFGYPIPSKLGENFKLNKGIISSNKSVNGDVYFQTDLPVWYGNSGGPCFDEYGNLLGLVTSIAFDNNIKLENLCFVTKSENILSLLKNNNLISNFQTRSQKQEFTDLVKNLQNTSVFIKVNY